MKRKIIKQGHNAFTITLPNEWVQNMNLKPKDEIDLIEDGNQLVINSKKNNEFNSVSFDISNLSIPLIWKYFSTIYREGYDEIVITFSDAYKRYENAYSYSAAYRKDKLISEDKKSLFLTIQDIVNRFIGMEIIEFNNKECIVRQMEEPSDKQFESSVKRIFFILDQFFQDLLIAVKTDDLRNLKETHTIDTNLDRFHDFCCRILSKTGCKSPHKSQLIFTTLYMLELLGDEFKAISDCLLKKDYQKERKNLERFSETIYEQFKKYTEIYNKFEHKKVKEIYETSSNLFQKYPELLVKNKKQEIFYHLIKISEFLYYLAELRLEEEYYNLAISKNKN
mgnify:CR=1 FL=1